MFISQNPKSGLFEAYDDNGKFLGHVSTNGSGAASARKKNKRTFDRLMMGLEPDAEDGGKGSGNWGHAGRPGEVGGSGAGGGKGGWGKGSKAKAEKARATVGAIKSSVNHAIKNYEPKTASYQEGSTERHAAEAAITTIKGFGTTRPSESDAAKMKEKKLSNISDQLRPYMVDKYKKAVESEPRITSDLLDIAEDLGTGMFGIPFRLKDANTKSDGSCRIADKIAEDIKSFEEDHPGETMSYEDAADGIKDIVRYTQACTTENMADNIEKTSDILHSKGYKCIKVKNTWDSANEESPYRGVNTAWISPDGQAFELQYHTADSLYGKEFIHPLYEEQRKPSTEASRSSELNAKMWETEKSLPRPVGIERIKENRWR